MPQREVICIIEDKADERAHLNRILSHSGYLVKDYDDGDTFLEELVAVRASCAIVDVGLPYVDIFGFVSELSRSRSDVPIVLCAASRELPRAVEAAKLGAVSVIEKPVEDRVLLQVVHRAVGSRGAEPSPELRPLGSGLVSRLTPRERDVLNLLLEGYQNKMIAYELGISQRTVEVYRARVMRRLDVGSFAELVRLAVQHQYPGRQELDARRPD